MGALGGKEISLDVKLVMTLKQLIREHLLNLLLRGNVGRSNSVAMCYYDVLEA
jgi:hypothetical protein